MAGLKDLLKQEPGYTYGDVLPVRRRTDGSGNPELAVPGLLSGAINSAADAFTLPGDVAAGRRVGTPEEAANLALNVVGGRNAGRLTAAAADVNVPRVVNNIAYPALVPRDAPSSMLTGRALHDLSQVTHASRKLSAEELADAMKTGFFQAPKEGSKHAGGKNEKWWSPADDQGIFGRVWNKGGVGSATVRVPIDKVPSGKGVSIKHAEVYDETAKKWVPAKQYLASGGIVVDHGNPAKRERLI